MTVGRQTNLEKGKYEELIAAIPQVMIQKHVAALCGVHETHLSRWLSRGETESEQGIDSVYAQFRQDYVKERTKVMRERINSVLNAETGWQAHAWILERCFREDFGKESEEMRELRAMFTQIVMGANNGKQEIRGSGTGIVPPRSTESG